MPKATLVERLEFLRDLYFLRERDLLSLTDVVNLQEKNLQTSSLRFYDFILSASPLLERSAKLFLDFFEVPETEKGEHFMRETSRFPTLLRAKQHCKVLQSKGQSVPFTISGVSITVRSRSFFDEELIEVPFEGFCYQQSGKKTASLTSPPFWTLYNSSKHEHKDYSKIYSEATLQNAIRCLAGSYLMLRFVAYDLLCNQIRASAQKTNKRNISLFMNNFYQHPMKTAKGENVILHNSNHPTMIGPYDGELQNCKGRIEMDSKFFGEYFWGVP